MSLGDDDEEQMEGGETFRDKIRRLGQTWFKSSLPFTFCLFFVFVSTQYSHRETDFGLISSLKGIVEGSYAGDTCVQSSRRLLNESYEERLLRGSASGSSASASAGGAFYLGKDLYSIKTLDDIFLWIDVTVIRWLWAEGPDGRGVILSFNSVIGGARIRQTRMTSSECPGIEELNATHDYTCYKGSGGDELAPIDNPQDGYKSFTASEDGHYDAWLDISQDSCQAVAHLSQLINSDWLRNGVDHVAVEIVLYNVQTAIFVVIEITFKVAMDGSITPKAKLKQLHTEIYKHVSLMVADFAFCALLLSLAVWEIVSFVIAARKGEPLEYFGWYRILNWMVVIIGSGFIIFFIYLFTSMHALAENVATIPNPPSSPDDSDYLLEDKAKAWEPRFAKLSECYDELLKLTTESRYCELWTFWYSLVIMMKFFQCFDANPKLNMLTVTLKKALLDIAYFMVVFLLVFGNFALGAYFLYGHQLYEWSDPALATNSAFRTLMGDFDFKSMYKIAPISAMIWFWSYMILFYLVMLNMLLAIIMDTYSEVKEQQQQQQQGEISSGSTLSIDDNPGLNRGGSGLEIAALSSEEENNEEETEVMRMLQEVHSVLKGVQENKSPNKKGLPTISNEVYQLRADPAMGHLVPYNNSPPKMTDPKRDRATQNPSSGGKKDTDGRLPNLSGKEIATARLAKEYATCWGQGPPPDNARPKLVGNYFGKSP